MNPPGTLDQIQKDNDVHRFAAGYDKRHKSTDPKPSGTVKLGNNSKALLKASKNCKTLPAMRPQIYAQAEKDGVFLKENAARGTNQKIADKKKSDGDPEVDPEVNGNTTGAPVRPTFTSGSKFLTSKFLGEEKLGECCCPAEWIAESPLCPVHRDQKDRKFKDYAPKTRVMADPPPKKKIQQHIWICRSRGCGTCNHCIFNNFFDEVSSDTWKYFGQNCKLYWTESQTSSADLGWSEAAGARRNLLKGTKYRKCGMSTCDFCQGKEDEFGKPLFFPNCRRKWHIENPESSNTFDPFYPCKKCRWCKDEEDSDGDEIVRLHRLKRKRDLEDSEEELNEIARMMGDNLDEPSDPSDGEDL